MSSSIDSQLSNDSSSGDSPNKSNGIKFTISAPGKVILHGEHSVVYDKLALAASLGLRTSVRMEEDVNWNDASFIDVQFPDINLQHSFNFKSIQNFLEKPLPINPDISCFNLEHPEKIDYDLHFRSIEEFLSQTENLQNLNKVQKNSLISFLCLFTAMFGSLNVQLRPFHFSVNSQLSIGAGTGSSASFAICLVASFLHYVKLTIRRSESSGNLSKDGYAPTLLTVDSDPTKFSEEELKVISNWGFFGEKIHHGNPSGIDNTICTYGSLLAFKKGCPPDRKKICFPLKLLLINTKVSRDTKTLVRKVADFINTDPITGHEILDKMDKLSEMALRCLNSLHESDLHQDTTSAFESLQDLAEANHEYLRKLGVSHATLEEIVRILKNHGLKGKLTGAGGGGYAICLVPPSFSEMILDAVLTDLTNGGFDVKLTTLGDDGVRVDS